MSAARCSRGDRILGTETNAAGSRVRLLPRALHWQLALRARRDSSAFLVTRFAS